MKIRVKGVQKSSSAFINRRLGRECRSIPIRVHLRSLTYRRESAFIGGSKSYFRRAFLAFAGTASPHRFTRPESISMRSSTLPTEWSTMSATVCGFV